MILQLLQATNAHNLLMSFRITKNEISKAHVFLHQMTKIDTHLLGVFIHKTKTLCLCLGTILALGAFQDERHERIVLADITKKFESCLWVFFPAESICTETNLRRIRLRGIHRESSIADYTKRIVGITLIKFQSLFVGTGEYHLWASTHSHGGGMAIQGFF